MAPGVGVAPGAGVAFGAGVGAPGAGELPVSEVGVSLFSLCVLLLSFAIVILLRSWKNLFCFNL